MASSPNFNFDDFDEQMEEALAQNTRAMSHFIIKHADGLEQPEVNTLFEEVFVTHVEGVEA